MAYYFGRDIRDLIINKLSTEFNAGLAVIDSTRSEPKPTPTPKKIFYNWDEGQFPCIMVDIEEEEIDNEELLTCNLEIIPKIFKVNILIYIKTSELLYLDNWIENYIENTQKILHGYKTENITWCVCLKSERSEIYPNKNENLKMATVIFEVRIN